MMNQLRGDSESPVGFIFSVPPDSCLFVVSTRRQPTGATTIAVSLTLLYNDAADLEADAPLTPPSPHRMGRGCPKDG